MSKVSMSGEEVRSHMFRPHAHLHACCGDSTLVSPKNPPEKALVYAPVTGGPEIRTQIALLAMRGATNDPPCRSYQRWGGAL